ncbi:Na(+)/H(+) antiporter subunit B [Streptomyces sp. NPDC018045]|uniref:Na(+)/H(+) antiporter subunit B n=1 Tax=Streptomyces sp. NPDC018045 TaxID=3365037 RepID=UPI003792903D
MTDVLIVLALALVAAAATAAVLARDPVRQSTVLALLGIGLALLFAILQAPDVALSQLAVGSALTPLMLLLSVRKVRRKGEEGGGCRDAGGVGAGGSGGAGRGAAGGSGQGGSGGSGQGQADGSGRGERR